MHVNEVANENIQFSFTHCENSKGRTVSVKQTNTVVDEWEALSLPGACTSAA